MELVKGKLDRAAIGRRIALARQSDGLSQAELARRMSHERTTQVAIEQGHRAVSVDELQRYQEVLARPLGYFFASHEPSLVQSSVAARLQSELIETAREVGELETRAEAGHDIAAVAERRVEKLIADLAENAARTRLRRHEVLLKLRRRGRTLLTAQDVATRLRTSAEAVHAKAARQELVALPTLGHGAVFPAAQFDGRSGELVKGLPAVLRALADAGPWGAAEFLITRNSRLGGVPLEILRKRSTNLNQVLLAARAWAGTDLPREPAAAGLPFAAL